eukprot:Em0011g97a
MTTQLVLGGTVLAGTLYLARRYAAGGVCYSRAKLDGKTVIITGANTGIGKETAVDLARRGARVILACRSAEKGEEAVVETEDGFEMQFSVNHLAHFLLTNLLLDRLKEAPTARIVNVSSDAYTYAKGINFDDLNSEKSYSPFLAYGQSKLANILFTRSLAKRLAGTSVIANCLHPGGVRTEIFRHVVSGTFTKAMDEAVEGVSGKYFKDCKVTPPLTKAAVDDDMAERLWKVSAELTGPAFCPFHLPMLRRDYTVLDPLGHHASTCKRGGDAVFRHNRLRDVVAELCRLAHLSVKVEAGNNLTPDHSHTRPADVLVQNWSRGRPAAFDICVTSPLNTLTLSEAGVCAGAAAQAGEEKSSSNFQPFQFGVACKVGAEKVIHSLRNCVEVNWQSGDVVILKVDMFNAFNFVSRQTVLEECATFFPELTPWVTWCYGSHTSSFHPQEADDECLNISQQNWYLDDGVIAGDRQAVARALDLMMELGPHLGLHTNLHKCELFSRNGKSFFPTSVKFSPNPNIIILGSPLGDLIHCTRSFAERCTQSNDLLGAITEVAEVDLHVAFLLLRLCASFCKHAQLSLNMGGLGLRSLSGHSPAAFISSLTASGFGSPDNIHLQQAVALFNSQVSQHSGGWVLTLLEVPLVPIAQTSSLTLWGTTQLMQTCGLCGHTAQPPEGHFGGLLPQGSPAGEDRGWDRGYPVAFDVTVTSPLTPATLNFSTVTEGAAAQAAEERNHASNDAKSGPTGLRIQHLLDVAEVPVPTSICSLLRGVINLLASGQAPAAISQYMAGGSLVALRKGTQDIRPIAVGESLRRLTSKCLCSLIKEDASAFFQPFQFGVASPQGCEKVIHGLRRCLDNHWHDSEFVCLKVDMKNAFNLVSRQSLLDQCTLHFPLLLPWTTWCYGQHPFLWHSMGTLTSEAGVQQGDPLGPFYFALVLHHLVLSISKDESCQDLLFNAWYLDDGVVAGPSTSVQHVMNKSCTPNLIILGAPIGEVAFCSSFIASKRAASSTLLSSLVKLGSCDPQIALILLRMCGGFTKLVHVARSTPPSLALDELHAFDEQVRCTFTECQAIDTTDSSWMQAQLSLSRGGLGLRSLAHHSNAAFIASISTAGLASPSDNFLADAVNSYNRHNKLRDVVLQTCHRACISAKAEAGSGLGHELRNTRPADILASNWLCGKPAAFDLTVVSPLNPTFISEAGRTAGSAAVAAELRKHSANDAKCSELGWTCIPLVAESYGTWGSEAVQAFSRLASYLATRTNSPKSKVVCSLYGRLNLTLVRANARALLLRCGCSLQEGDISSS